MTEFFIRILSLLEYLFSHAFIDNYIGNDYIGNDYIGNDDKLLFKTNLEGATPMSVGPSPLKRAL